MELYDFVQKLKKQDKIKDIEKQAELDIHINRGLRNIEDVVTSIARKPRQLINFAYELRKLDTKDKYSFEFLNGQVKP